jgi:hypothetical protein
MNPTPLNRIGQDYSVRLVVRPEHSEFYPLRDAWLAQMAADHGVRTSSEYLDGRFRDVVRTEFHSATLLVKPHEWGVEYLVSFALGVASGVVANVVYGLLQGQLPRYAEMLEKLSSSGCRDIRIDIELSHSNKTVKINVLEPGRGPISVTLAQVTRAIDETAPAGLSSRRAPKSPRSRNR